jgi:photosystem II stability/assembly factor-like uncharacterized protein
MKAIICLILKQSRRLFAVSLLLLFQSYLFAQEHEDAVHSWMWQQRIFPTDSVPRNGYRNATLQQFQKRQQMGFVLSPTTNPWQPIGPTISGAAAGRVTSVKYDPNYDPYTRPYIYISAHGGGVWKSVNGGNTFFPITDDLPTQSSGAICLDPNHPNTIYYASGGTVDAGWNFYGLGVFKSTDGGNTWSGGHNAGLPPLTYSYRIVVNPDAGHSNVVYLAEHTGLYISYDAGVTWERKLPPLNDEDKACNDVVTSNNGATVYAIGGRSGMYPPIDGIGYWVSYDYGANFQQQFQIPNIARSHLSVSRANDNYVYAVVLEGNVVHAFASHDGGVTFPYRQNLPSDWFGANDFFFVQASPHHADTAFIGFGRWTCWIGFFRTINGGANWLEMYACPGADHNCLDFNPNQNYPNEILRGCDGGLFRSANLGDSWEELTNSLSIAEGYRVSSDVSNPDKVMLAVTDAAYSRTTNGGINWSPIIEGGNDGTNVVYSVLDPTHTHLVASKGACYCIQYSTNGGSYFLNSDIVGYKDGVEDWIQAFKEDPYIPGVIFCPLRDYDNHDYVNINLSTNYGQHYESNRYGQSFKPIYTQDQCASPQTFTMCEKDTNIIYVSTIDFEIPEWGCRPEEKSILWRTTDAGQNWRNLRVYRNGLPYRYISSVITDPASTDILYLTLSGWNANTPGAPGHVFKSTNKGDTWFDISGSPTGEGLPDIPVNAMILRYTSCSDKELIAATDAGIYRSLDDGQNQWQELAYGLPNSVVLSMDYNYLSGKLRAVTFGRSVWEVNINTNPEVAIYVHGTKVLHQDPALGYVNVSSDIVVCSDGKLQIPYACTVKMAEGKKIIVMDGGEIDASSGSPITLTSQSGTWAGIKIQGNTSSAVLKNITFRNSSTPLVIEGSPGGGPPQVLVQNCTFENAPIEITNRKGVKIYDCVWNYAAENTADVSGVLAVGADYLEIKGCNLNYSENSSSVGFEILSSYLVSIVSNNIDKTSTAISVSNCFPYIKGNSITNSVSNYALYGIVLDNCVDGNILYDTITDYQVGLSLQNYSSPLMLENQSVSSNNTVSTYNSALFCGSTSAPRLAPTVTPEGVIWDAGFNKLKSNDNGAGIFADYRQPNDPVPVLYQGCNDIFGADLYLYGGDIVGTEVGDWHAEYNSWTDDPPNPDKFSVNWAAVHYEPWGCPFGQGGGQPSSLFDVQSSKFMESANRQEPPPPLVVDYGTGFLDTLEVTSANAQLPSDWAMVAAANRQIMLNQFQNAVTTLQQQIAAYHDSTSAKFALKRLFYCYNRMGADTSAFSGLRNYYLSLASSYNSDTALVRTAEELSRKCLVKMRQLPPAIGEYENVIQNTQDSAEILSAEINIIEIYLLMGNQGGNAPSFTGRLSYLKPANLKDGVRMLHSKMFKFSESQKKSMIPAKYSLSQNYPNPFNAMTKINYSLPKPGKVTIKLYDVLGRLVKELVNEFKDAGYYSVTFDAGNLASGVYFYRLEAGEFISSKKMVVVK